MGYIPRYRASDYINDRLINTREWYEPKNRRENCRECTCEPTLQGRLPYAFDGKNSLTIHYPESKRWL